MQTLIQAMKTYFLDSDNSTLAKVVVALTAIAILISTITGIIWTVVQILAKLKELRSNSKKAATAQTRYGPATNLPKRNPHFIGRSDILKELLQGFLESDTVTLTQTISGLGGVGKSQTALEYAYRNLSKYSCAVWWINLPLEDCRKLLLRFDYPDDKEHYSEQTVLPALQKWYDEHRNWLLIFDNMEDYETLRPWLPSDAKGHVLITTRNKKSWEHVLDLDVFSEKDALDFFRERTKTSVDESAKTLAEQLGYLPLALEQAASYMVETKMDYASYLALLLRQGLRLLERGKPINYEEVVATTWKASANKLSEAAQQLLGLCSYFAPDNIPTTLFFVATRALLVLPQPLQEKFADELDRMDVINELTRYSMFKRNGTDLYSIHRLVQQVVRQIQGNNALLTIDMIVLLAAMPVEYITRNHFSRFSYLPEHAWSALSFAEEAFAKDNEKMKCIGLCYHRLGYGYYCRGEYDSALKAHEKAKLVRTVAWGMDHSETAVSYNEIGLMHNRMGSFEKALENYEMALDIYEKLPDSECVNVAAMYNNIGEVHSELGNYQKALEMSSKALSIFEKVLGAEHPDTVAVCDNIAGVFASIGEYERALDMHEKALSIRKKVLDARHPDMATSYNNIGVLYCYKEEFETALNWLLRSYKIRLHILGVKHPDTLATFTGICSAYVKAGNKEKKFLKWLTQAMTENDQVNP